MSPRVVVCSQTLLPTGPRPDGAAEYREVLWAKFSNFAPHRPEAGWGCRGPEDPTGFTPVVNEFENIDPCGAVRRVDPR